MTDDTASAPEPASVSVEALPAHAVRGLRTRVLRPPGTPPVVLPEDERPGTLHVGAFADGVLACVATIYPEAMPGTPDAPDGPTPAERATAFRLRGMATDPAHQGRGLGSAVVRRLLAHVAAEGASVLWCNARVSAQGFYERLGFVTEGPEFDIPGIGPHYVMWRRP